MDRLLRIQSPIGDIALVWKDSSRVMIQRLILPIEFNRIAGRSMKPGGSGELDRIKNAILEYFNGSRKKIPVDQLDWSVCGDFQREVLRKEWTIPYGKVLSYRDLASLVKNDRHARAVGSALANNPFPIIIPCHRTVRADRSLGGYRGGLGLKKRLLEQEGVRFDAGGRILEEYFGEYQEPA